MDNIIYLRPPEDLQCSWRVPASTTKSSRSTQNRKLKDWTLGVMGVEWQELLQLKIQQGKQLINCTLKSGGEAAFVTNRGNLSFCIA